MNPAGGRPSADQLARSAPPPRPRSAPRPRRGTCRGSCWATRPCAPNPGGWQAHWGCRPSTSTPRRYRRSSRGRPRGPRPRHAFRSWPSQAGCARSLASEPELTRNTVSRGSGSVAANRSLNSTTSRVIEPRIRVELAQLPGGGVGHPGVGVAQHGDVVDHVEVDAPVGGHQVVPSAPFDLRWRAVVKLLHRSETRLAARQQVARLMHIDRGQSEQRPRVTGERKPAWRQRSPGEQRRGRRADGLYTDLNPPIRSDLCQWRAPR